jgi:hypothetical protein
MHQGCVRSRQRRRGGRGTWWRTWPSWPWVARATIFAATGRAVLAAHQAGVAEATAYLNEHLGTRRGHGGHQHVDGRAAGGRLRPPHVRAGDPLLHTHLVVANRSRAAMTSGQASQASSVAGL